MSEAADSPSTKKSPMQPGQRYGRLTTVAYVHTGHDGTAFWRFRCDCGTVRVLCARTVVTKTRSCGCIRRENAAALARSRALHGEWRTSEFNIWLKMKKRCENPNDKNFLGYGGRGISVCERWRNSFKSFIEDMGRRPSLKHSIDRIDVNGNYCPENCRWATYKEQGRNKRNNRIVPFQGRLMTLAEASERSGLDRELIKSRVHRGWTIEKALSEPPMLRISVVRGAGRPEK